jgi:hypothetical protein
MAVVGWYEDGCYGCHQFYRKMAVVMVGMKMTVMGVNNFV